MQAIDNIDMVSLLDTLLSLTAAFVAGGVIGLERQYRQRTAGLRTNVLVAVGAAIFVDMANRLGAQAGATHVVAYVVSGVGFLGAGAIMREDGSVRGLNTAATLWCSAAVGACAGADLLVEALLGTAFVVAANTLLRPVVDRLNRQPLDNESVEVPNIVRVIVPKSHQMPAMALLTEVLESASYPVREMDLRAFGPDAVEIEAVLAATGVDGDALDAVIATLSAQEFVTQAFWSPSTTE